MSFTHGPILSRRKVLEAATLLSAACVLSPRSAYAAKTFRIVVGVEPGSTLDISARAFAEQLKFIFNYSVEVENDGGGGGRFALSAAVEAKANPNLIAFVPGSIIYQALKDSELAKQFANVRFLGSLGRDQRVLLIRKQEGISSFAELLASGKKITVATPRATASSHLDTLLTNVITGSKIKPIGGYGSAGRKVALLSGEVNAALGSYDTFSDMISDGQLIPLLAINKPILNSPLSNLPLLSDFAKSDVTRRMTDIISITAECDQMLVVPAGVSDGEYRELDSLFEKCAPKVTEKLRAASGAGTTLPVNAALLKDNLAKMISDIQSYSEVFNKGVVCGSTLSDDGSCTM